MTSKDQISEMIGNDSKNLFADDFDDALIDTTVGISARDVVVYDYEQSVEYVEFNLVNARVGEYTPKFIKLCKEFA